MSSKTIAFRCPVALMQRVDAVAAALGTTRSAIVLEAVRLLSREVRSRGGYLVPPYEGEDILASLQRSDTLQNGAPEEPESPQNI